MKKLFVIFIAIFSIAACDRSDDFMKCGEFEVKIAMEQNDSLIATINGDEAKLTQVVSASGARYSGVLNDTSVVLWNKGSDWTLILNDDVPIDCE